MPNGICKLCLLSKDLKTATLCRAPYTKNPEARDFKGKSGSFPRHKRYPEAASYQIAQAPLVLVSAEEIVVGLFFVDLGIF